jgi:hypothetical protein
VKQRFKIGDIVKSWLFPEFEFAVDEILADILDDA